MAPLKVRNELWRNYVNMQGLRVINLNITLKFPSLRCEINSFLSIATSHTALIILTEVAQDYFLNLGKTLRTYMDDYGKKMAPEVNTLLLYYDCYFCS